jgi:hypothetical protein
MEKTMKDERVERQNEMLFDRLIRASDKVLRGLEARIDRASERGEDLPLFDGIAELTDALNALGRTRR